MGVFDKKNTAIRDSSIDKTFKKTKSYMRLLLFSEIHRNRHPCKIEFFA